MRPSPGFTLTEILAVAGITLALIGMTAVLSGQTIRNVEFSRVRETVRNELVAAQADALSGTFDSAWGVAVFPNAITRYKGATYAQRDTTYDQRTTFSDDVTLSGTDDIPFTRPRGFPASAASIAITDGSNSATITVNPVGAISVH